MIKRLKAVRTGAPLYTQTLVAMVLGGVAGHFLGQWFPGRLGWMDGVGNAIIQIIKAFAAPLLFLAVLESAMSGQFRKRGVAWMLGLSAINALAAVVIALVLLNGFHPGRYLSFPSMPTTVPKLKDGAVFFANVIPESVLSPWLSGSLLGLIFLAIIFGLGLHALRKDPAFRAGVDKADEVIRFLLALHLKILGGIVLFVPIAVFTVVAKAVADRGFAIFSGLGVYMAVCISGLLLQIALVYVPWILFVSKVGIRKFWHEAKEPLAYSFGTNSSLATLPMTLNSLSRMKVSPGAARLAACLGANFNHDGIILYEAIAALFLAQVYHVPLTVTQQATVAMLCIFTAVGVGGIPNAGFISLTMILAAVGLPMQGLPVLLTVDWLIGRFRAVTNVYSDLTAANVLDRIGV